MYTIFTLDIRSAPYYTCPKSCISILLPDNVSANCWMSGKQCTPSVTSNLGLHCLDRSVYPNTVEPRYLELAYFEIPFISK